MSVIESRPRKDVIRNRGRILEAAKELFAERGLGVTLHDIARHAGVGVGTIYRHFPDKNELIDLLFEEQLERLEELSRQALADPDPWHAVVWYHEQALELEANDKGLRQLLLSAAAEPDRATRYRERLHPPVEQLIERAKAANVVRPDVETQDFGVVRLMVGALIDASRHVDPDLWRRYLTLGLQGLRPQAAPLASLEVPTLPATRMEDLLVSAWRLWG